MIESEYKCMIDSSLYQNIVNKLDLECKGCKGIQVNYYYDTDDFKLDKNDITFRVRQKEKNLNIEIKYPVNKDGLLRVKDEVVCSIDKVPRKINISNSNLIGYLDGMRDIILIGLLVTERISYSISSGIKIDIDKSYYYGAIDYELEIEFEENFQVEASKLLEEITGNKYFVPQCGKRERFMSKLKHMQELSYKND